MKIIFLNVCTGILEDSLLRYIDEQKQTTDVFCFQESSDSLQIKNKNILSGYQNIYYHKNLQVGDNYFLSTYVKDGLQILSTNTMFDKDIALGLGQNIKLKVNKTILNLSNIHGVWKPEYNKSDTEARLQQSRKILELNNVNGLTIIGGDFNLNPDTESVLKFEKFGYINLIKEFGIKTTRNEYAWSKYPNNKHYFSDYVFVSQEVKVKSFEVPDMTISDHLPMILEIDG